MSRILGYGFVLLAGLGGATAIGMGLGLWLCRGGLR